MAGKPRRNPDLDAFFEGIEGPARRIAEALRETVLGAAPDLQEKIKWRTPTYSFRGDVCYIAPYADHVNLGFHSGAALPDSEGLLEGTGKGLRHVKVRSVEQAHSKEIRDLVKRAAAQDRA